MPTVTELNVKKWSPVNLNLKYRVRIEQMPLEKGYTEKTSYYFTDKHEAMNFAELAFKKSEHPTVVFVELVNVDEADNN